MSATHQAIQSSIPAARLQGPWKKTTGPQPSHQRHRSGRCMGIKHHHEAQPFQHPRGFPVVAEEEINVVLTENVGMKASDPRKMGKAYPTKLTYWSPLFLGWGYTYGNWLSIKLFRGNFPCMKWPPNAVFDIWPCLNIGYTQIRWL